MQHCQYNSNGFNKCAWPKQAATDNQLLSEMKSSIVQKAVAVICRV